jgi:adenylate cyclase
MDPRVTVARKLKKSPNIRNRNIIWGAVAVLLIFGVIGIWQIYLKQPSVEPASEEKMVFPLPAKPSIAVLPFVNIGGDPDQGYFCDGLTDEIITSLSKIPKLFVISRNSVFTYKNKPVKINKVAEELGVRYVLEGSIRKAGDKIRITAQLIDALSGHHLWAERYDRQLKEIFSVQDDLTKNIITALRVKLSAGEHALSTSRGTESLEAYLKLLKAGEIWRKMTKENNILARQLANETIVLDPDYATAYGLIAATHMMDVFLGTSKLPKESLKKAIAFNKKALALDDSLATSYSRLGLLYVMMRQHDKGIKQAERGVELEPNSAVAHDILGMTLSYAGRHDEAVIAHLKAIRLEPLAPGNYYYHLCLAYLFSGNCNEAIAACEEALRRVNNLFVRLNATVTYSICGEEKKAREMAEEVLRISPNFSSDNYVKRLFYKDAADSNRYIGALQNAGLN